MYMIYIFSYGKKVICDVVQTAVYVEVLPGHPTAAVN